MVSDLRKRLGLGEDSRSNGRSHEILCNLGFRI